MKTTTAVKRSHPLRAAITGPGFDEDARNSLGYLLRKANRLMLSEFERKMQSLGLSMAQGFALRDLAREDGLYQKDLANRSGAHENTMVTMLDALEDAGLVLRTRSKDDRRKTHVYLSAKGQKMCEAVLVHCRDSAIDALHSVNDEDIATTLRVLKTIITNMDTQPETPS